MNFKMILEKEEFIELYNRYIKIRFPDSFGIDLYNNNISLKYYDVKHLQFFTTEIGSNFIIVFLGSNERKDWFFNFLFRKKEVPYKEKGTNKKIKVHSGFYKSYLVVRDIVHKELKGKRSVLFLGQSFGSAVATLAALDVQYNFPEIHTIENYITGTPRVGNKYFVDSYNKSFDGGMNVDFSYPDDFSNKDFQKFY